MIHLDYAVKPIIQLEYTDYTEQVYPDDLPYPKIFVSTPDYSELLEQRVTRFRTITLRRSSVWNLRDHCRLVRFADGPYGIIESIEASRDMIYSGLDRHIPGIPISYVLNKLKIRLISYAEVQQFQMFELVKDLKDSVLYSFVGFAWI